MPNKKKRTPIKLASTKKRSVVADKATDLATTPDYSFRPPAFQPTKIFSNRNLVILAALVFIGLLLWKNKGLIVAATVNGQPVFRWQLEDRMVSRYGNTTLGEIVNETLIRQAAVKRNVSVAPKEVDAKITEIEKSLDGKITLSDALAQQGMTMPEFRTQVELQLLMEKMVGSSVTVSDAEIADYIAKNKDSLSSSDPASQSTEAKNALETQKKNDAFRSFFDSLKKDAKIVKLL